MSAISDTGPAGSARPPRRAATGRQSGGASCATRFSMVCAFILIVIFLSRGVCAVAGSLPIPIRAR